MSRLLLTLNRDYRIKQPVYDWLVNGARLESRPEQLTYNERNSLTPLRRDTLNREKQIVVWTGGRGNLKFSSWTESNKTSEETQFRFMFIASLWLMNRSHALRLTPVLQIRTSLLPIWQVEWACFCVDRSTWFPLWSHSLLFNFGAQTNVVMSRKWVVTLNAQWPQRSAWSGQNKMMY